MNTTGKNIIERWIYPINNNLIFIIMIAKKYFGLLAAVAVVAAAGWNYQQNKQYDGLSELAIENVEALARGEGDPNEASGKVMEPCRTNGVQTGQHCVPGQYWDKCNYNQQNGKCD